MACTICGNCLSNNHEPSAMTDHGTNVVMKTNVLLWLSYKNKQRSKVPSARWELFGGCGLSIPTVSNKCVPWYLLSTCLRVTVIANSTNSSCFLQQDGHAQVHEKQHHQALVKHLLAMSIFRLFLCWGNIPDRTDGLLKPGVLVGADLRDGHVELVGQVLGLALGLHEG